MTTFRDLRQQPERLGAEAGAADVERFIRAAEEIVERDQLDEETAIDLLWGNGNWWPRVAAVLGPEGDAGDDRRE